MSGHIRRFSKALLIAAAAVWSHAAAAQIVLADQNRSVALACTGVDALIRGDSNHVVLAGQCRSLRIEGNRNVVSVELARPGTIRITGDYNQVVYTPSVPPPPTTLRGYYNQVVPGPADSTGGRLVLDGALDRRDVPCGGLDVVIRESQARYVLRGGCRSVTVEGRSDAIAAELLPSARLVIGGIGVVVNYTLIAQGPPPVVVVTAPGARATHFVRYGDSALFVPTGPSSAGPISLR